MNKDASTSPPGVTVAICCHNSAERLPPTLAHLAAQRVAPGIAWEVLVIDNASTDDTFNTAHGCWSKAGTTLLRVVREPKAGLIYARRSAFQHARYEFVTFIDDDNWVCPEWVQAISDLMTEHPDIGVCGSINEPVCEVAPPWWFERFKDVLGITADDAPVGDLTKLGAVVLGAGMTIRLSAWRRLVAAGFSPLLTGRQGKSLMAGEDSELSLAIRLSGWRIWRDPRLHLKHFLPARRLDWQYVRRLYRGYGESSIRLDGYQLLESTESKSWKRPFRRSWQWHMLASLAYLVGRPYKSIRALTTPLEGDPDIPMLELHIGRVMGFARDHHNYRAGREQVRQFLNSPIRNLSLDKCISL